MAKDYYMDKTSAVTLGSNDLQKFADDGGQGVTPQPQTTPPAPQPPKETPPKDTVVESLGKPQHSWDRDADRLAGIQHQQDIVNTRRDFLDSRSQVENLGQEAQQAHAMAKYSKGQGADKAGWTGGYVLDSNRQREYLQQSIAAQMYGTMELQRAGYDAQLAAARLAYDLGKEHLALERYREAYQQAVMRAELTGTWVSPEVLDLVNQFELAQGALSEYDAADPDFIPDEEYERANHLMKQIEAWFALNNIQPESIPVLARTIAQQQLDLDREIFADSRIQAALDSKEPWQYLMTDNDGNYIFDENTGRPKVIDLSIANTAEAYEFYQNNPVALKRYLEMLATQTIVDFLSTVDQDNMTNEQLQSELNKYLQSRNLTQDYLDEFEDTIYDLISGGYSTTITTHGKNFDFQIGRTTTPKDDRDDANDPDNLTYTPVVVDTRYMDTQNDVTTIMNILQTPDNQDIHELYNLIANMDVDALFTSSAAVDSWWAELTGIAFYADMFGAGSKKAGETVEELSGIISEIDLIFGEDNLTMLLEEAERYENMTDAQRLRLSREEQDLLERVDSFARNYLAMQLALNIASMNDTSVLDGFEYVGDSWRSTGYAWSNVSSGIDALRATAQTVNSVVDTATGGIVGAVRWIFGIK